uniref:Oxygen sensor histidine kinase NreB n=1 Tax=uncultured Acidobacteriota bacterium TaxID=171953 RepID=Q7X326_9BACT|nr:putative sensory transduction histidine kinase [uncultured Acidobacteriota bacterium]
MRLKTWPVAALGLGSLLLLIALSMLASSRRAQEIFTQLDELNTYHHNVDAKLRRLRSDVHLSGIFVRDYLLDVERERAPEYRQSLSEFRDTNTATLADLRALLNRDDDRIVSLQARLEEYWQTFEPLFDWTTTEKILHSASFLRREVVPRREAALAIAQEIEELNNANLTMQRAEVEKRLAALRRDLLRMLGQSLSLGLIVALVAVYRLRVLEKRSDQQRVVAEDAERQMRQLSQQLVATQEDERKNLSRELHDHVGQVLTALRMEIGRIERMRAPADARLGAAVIECKTLVDDMFRTVRNLALGLRPSMLDDFGLQAALEWHVRDLASRYGVDVELTMTGDFDALPDRYRTCVYRAVQEALTNCVRHASARSITVTVTSNGEQLEAFVADDGVGLDQSRRRNGLGLRGIEERVRDLNGSMTIDALSGKGTKLAIRLPLPEAESEAPLRRAAGQ